jgi:hypothetical protein
LDELDGRGGTGLEPYETKHLVFLLVVLIALQQLCISQQGLIIDAVDRGRQFVQDRGCFGVPLVVWMFLK